MTALAWLARGRTLLTANTSSTLIVANLLASLLSLVSAPIVSRSIGPDGRGVTAAVLASFYIVPIVLAAGVPLELRRRAASSRAAEADLRASRDLWVVQVVPSVAIALLLGATVFSSLQGLDRIVAVVGLALSPFALSWLGDNAFLAGRGRYRSVAAIRIVQPVVFLVAVLALAVTGSATVSTVLIVNVAATIVTAAVAHRLSAVPLRGPRSSRRSMARGGLTYAGGAIADAANNRLDQIVALPLIGSYQLGLYSIASVIGLLPVAVAQALGAVAFRDVAAAPPDEVALVTRRYAQQGLASGIACAVVLAVASPVVIPLVFGDAFAPAVLPALIAAVGSAPLVAAFVIGMTLAARSQGLQLTVCQVLTLVLAIGALIVLGPALGATGAALASAGGFVVQFALVVLVAGCGPAALLATPASLVQAARSITRRA